MLFNYCFLPIPIEALNVFFDERITHLYLNKVKLGECFDGVMVLYGDDYRIASLDAANIAIKNEYTFAFDECPYFSAMMVYLI